MKKNHNQKIRVGLIGLGSQTLNDHLPSLLKRSDVIITEVCDNSEISREKFRQKYPMLLDSVVIYNSISEMAFSVDFCIVAVPHNQYVDTISLLISKKVPFIKEKPFARDIEEMQKILSMKNIDKYCFVSSQRRYSTLYKKAHQEKGKLGILYLFNATYKLKILDPHKGWRGDRKIAGGGCLMDMGYHIIDQLLWWFGKPDHIFVTTSNLAIPNASDYAEDSSVISFRYKSGLHGSIVLSRTAGEKKEEFVLVGSDGQMIWNKRSLEMQNKEGLSMFKFNIENDEEMIDNQLDFFISRIKNNEGFTDIIEQHKRNTEFIHDCYLSANILQLNN